MATEFTDSLLNEKQLATWLGISIPSLQRLRSNGSGPPFVQLSEPASVIVNPRSNGGLRRGRSPAWVRYPQNAQLCLVLPPDANMTARSNGPAVTATVTHAQNSGAAGLEALGSPCGTSAAADAPAHDKTMAARFLACLDPQAKCFTFMFIGDGPDRHAEVFHGTLEEGWPKVLALNTVSRRVGVFVTVNETDFKGRREENIVRPRALFVDADNPDQIASCLKGIEACGAPPDMIVESGRGMHFYWLANDIPRDQFSAAQKHLINKLGTDKAIHDLPRVMRLPGTLHLKNENQPRQVRLRT